jgi:hypothetical protein
VSKINLINLKKKLLLLAILTSAAFTTYAQNEDPSPKLGVGFSIGAAVGSNSAYYPVASGVHFKFEYPVNSTPLSITFSAGYTFYVSSNGYNYSTDGYGDSYSNGSLLSFVPVTVGAKYYVANKLYLEGDVGASFNLNSSDENGKPISGVSPIVAPYIGYTIPFGATRASVDLSLGYEASPQTGGGYNQALFKATFNFGLR